MALANPLYGLRATFTDKCGKPLIGGKVFSYEGNSLTPKTTYTDAFMSTPNTNPVVLDETGKADIFLDGTYRFQVFSRDGVLIEDKNNVSNILDLGPIIEKLDQFNTDFQKNISDFQNEKAAALEDFENTGSEKLAEFQQEINIAAAAGAGANGWTDLLVQLQDGSSLRQFIDIQKNKNSERVSIADFGAKGNDDQTLYDTDYYSDNASQPTRILKQTADGLAINRAIKWLRQRGGGSLYIPPCEPGKSYRTYGYLERIDFPCVIYGAGALSLIKSCDNSPTDQNGYGILHIQPASVSEITLMNFKIDGNAEVRPKPTLEWRSYNIHLTGKPILRMLNITSVNAAIDCFCTRYINDPGLAAGERVSVKAVNCIFDNAYRNSVSLVSGWHQMYINCDFLRGGYVYGGTNPKFCIDIEPTTASSSIKDLKFVSCLLSRARNAILGGTWGQAEFYGCTLDADNYYPDDVAKSGYPWAFNLSSQGDWTLNDCKVIGRKDTFSTITTHYNSYNVASEFSENGYLRIKNTEIENCGFVGNGRRLVIENVTAKNSLHSFDIRKGAEIPFADVRIKDLKLINVFDVISSSSFHSFFLHNSVNGDIDINGLTCEIDLSLLQLIPVSKFTKTTYYGPGIYANTSASSGKKAMISNVHAAGYYKRLPAYLGIASPSASNFRDWGNPNLPPADTAVMTANVAATLTDGTVANNVVTNKGVTGTATQNSDAGNRVLGGRTTPYWRNATMWGNYD